MKPVNEKRFAEITEIPAQDFDESASYTEIEMSYGKDVLREWVKVARWLMPDADVKGILATEAERL